MARINVQHLHIVFVCPNCQNEEYAKFGEFMHNTEYPECMGHAIPLTMNISYVIVCDDYINRT